MLHRTTNDPSHVAARAARVAAQEKTVAIETAKGRVRRRFSQMTPAERDDLLYALAVEHGLVEPDEVRP